MNVFVMLFVPCVIPSKYEHVTGGFYNILCSGCGSTLYIFAQTHEQTLDNTNTQCVPKTCTLIRLLSCAIGVCSFVKRNMEAVL